MGASNEFGLSLVDQKRLQWAREKEEMARIGELFTSTSKQIERTSIRTFYTNVDVVRGHGFESSARQYSENEFHHENNFQYERIRSPSLPPIERERPRKVMTSTEEDTSGYLSDLGTPQTPELKNTKRVKSRTRSKHSDRSKYYSDPVFNRSKGHQSHFVECNVMHEKSQKEEHNRKRYERQPSEAHALHRSEFAYGQGRKVSTDMTDNEHDIDFSLPKYSGNHSFVGGMPKSCDTPSSSSSGASCDVAFKVREERAKWGDRGVTVGHFYDPMSRGTKKTEPSWLQKYEIDSPPNEGSARSESYTRGQNTPIDSNVLAERLTKRQKALEFQNAIKDQLLERESRKKREQEKRLLEEKLEEERLMRQIEIERIRLEDEQRQQQKKFECERKKQEVMMRALEQAEMDAKLEKDKKRREKGFPTKSYENCQEKNFNSNHINNVMEHKMIRQSDYNSADTLATTNGVRSAGTADEDDADGGIGSADDEEEVGHDDNGEKILIGTPINLKMKDLQKFRHIPRTVGERGVNGPPTDMDGVALVLQSMPSGIPIPLTHDFLNLTNGFGNMPVIAMLAHQIQHFNEQNGTLLQSEALPVATAASPEQDLISNDIECSTSTTMPTSKRNDNDPREYISTNNSKNESAEQNKIVCEKCIIVSQPSPGDDNKLQLCNKFAERKISVPHEGTFTKVVSRRDAATTMSTTKTSHNDGDKYDVLVNLSFHELREAPSCDASTQTDDKSAVTECDFCVRHHNCTNQMDYLKEMSKAVTSLAEELKKHQLVPLTGRISPKQGDTADCNGKSPTLRSSSRDYRSEKTNSERPKWGVNRPSAQYVKASERDPFYLRNRNRIRQKCYEVKSAEKLPDDENLSEKITRNIGTQIFPIKTDGSGKIFLNFREASFVIDEAQVKKNLRNKYTASSRRFNRVENSDKSNGRALPADKDINLTRMPSDRVNLDVDLE